MESTSCRDNCPFVKQGFCNGYKECPNHIETWWMPPDNGQPVKLDDCAPKRMVLQQQEMQARFDLVTQALVQSRNEYAQLCGYLKNLIEMSQVVLKQDQNIKEIKHEEYPRLIANESNSS